MTYDDLKYILILRDDRSAHDDIKGVELAQALAEHIWQQMRPASKTATRGEQEEVLHASGTAQDKQQPAPAEANPDNPFKGL